MNDILNTGLSIEIQDPDDHYLGIVIKISNGRYTGQTRIYAGLSDLSDLAKVLEGFPETVEDKREFTFGYERSRDVVGGYCHLVFKTWDRVGHTEIIATMEDDKRDSLATAEIPVRSIEASAYDRFVEQLRKIEKERDGSAALQSSSL